MIFALFSHLFVFIFILVVLFVALALDIFEVVGLEAVVVLEGNDGADFGRVAEGFETFDCALRVI